MAFEEVKSARMTNATTNMTNVTTNMKQ